ncbi:hypothetical protein, partial [Staphylococcus felis]|uniref:hypothetical protein n=1 Tax=Staphylococcus felis TaxID=46127 RepID=UPI001EE89DEB
FLGASPQLILRLNLPNLKLIFGYGKMPQTSRLRKQSNVLYLFTSLSYKICSANSILLIYVVLKEALMFKTL